MATFNVQITWVEADDSRNAACIGLDERVQIEADTAADAVAEAQQGAIYAHHDEWERGRYVPVAEVVE